MSPDNVLQFWFNELKPQDWFRKSEQLDTNIRKRFGDLHQQALGGQLADWRNTPQGALAEIIVLDQFSRNLYRGRAQAFAADAMALQLAQAAIARGDDQTLSPTQKSFMYLPFMHSESPEVHKEAVRLFSQPGLEANLRFEKLHKAIIDRFGRYPHRNEIMGRVSTPEEIQYVKDNPGF